jgi:regulator of protease activity HflC (stomatin/prohibitin superfamily)
MMESKLKAYLWPADGTPPPPMTRTRWRRFVDRHLPSVVIYLMVLTLVGVVLWPHMVITVPSGYVGVLWKRFGSGTVLDPRLLKNEGFNGVLPWNRVFLYDLRLQFLTDSYNAISSDGVNLTASVVVRYRLQRDAVPVLHQAIGPNYQQVLIQPGIGSLTREVIAQYTAEQVYSTARQEIQEKIRDLVENRLSEKMMEHEGEESYRVSMRDTIILYDILVTGIELPAAIVAAINRKTEQYYIAEEYKFRVEREKRESERKKIEGEGIRDFQQTVSQGINESYLRWRGIEATLQLSQSTNAKVVIIGSGKDGLPVILGNVDSSAPPAGSAQPSGGSAAEKEKSTPAAAPTLPFEKTPAAALTTPPEKIPPATSGAAPAASPAPAATPSAQESRSLWPITLSDIESYLAKLLLPAGKTESKPPAAEQPR